MKKFKITAILVIATAVFLWLFNFYILRNTKFIYLGAVPLNTKFTKIFPLDKAGKYSLTLLAYDQINKHETHYQPEMNEFQFKTSTGTPVNLNSRNEFTIHEPTTFEYSGSIRKYSCFDCADPEGSIEEVYLYVEKKN